MRRSALAVAIAALPLAAFAATDTELPVVTVRDTALPNTPIPAAYHADTVDLLLDTPGMNAYTAGGVSSLPTLHGLADDRLRIKVDGMDLIAACPNHMNSPLSYVAPSAVGSFKVYTGITPVAVGGDSIGGAIVVNSAAPVFAAPGQVTLTQGEVGAFYRSNGNATGAHFNATYATETLSLGYTGSTAESENYKAAEAFKNYTATGRPGHTLPKDEVGSTAYKAHNHALSVAYKLDNHLLEARLGYQDIPYELYPGQRMDMLANTQHSYNLRYLGRYDWGSLEARAYHEEVNHYMDFGADKKLSYGVLTPPANTTGATYEVIGMPMYTRGRTTGLAIKSDIALSQRDTLRLGWEQQKYRLDDWWPPAPDCGVGNCWGGMAPLTFLNINDGQRDRKALFGEIESRWSQAWLTLFGLRLEQVRTDTGDVHGYTTPTTPLVTVARYETSSVGTRAAFNAMNRERTDNNIDWTALARYTPSEQHSYEFGVARKTRSPNLYERYSWSTNSMAQEMNNFVGDGNAYVGNPDLKPEVAHTFSLTSDWHSTDGEWGFQATPYLTYVRDFIDAVRMATPLVNDFVKLQYANQSARIYGLDLSGRMPLGTTMLSQWGLRGTVSYTRGENRDTGDGLYNIMPLNARLVLTQSLAGWNNALELVAVGRKDDVSAVRKEIKTGGYSLINLRASYAWSKVRLDVGIDNLFDRMYYLPLGGAYTGQGQTMSFTTGMGGPAWGLAVPGAGRSLHTAVTIKF